MIQLKDALQDRGLVDRWGFIGFALVGALLIWGLKQLTSFPVELIAAAAAALMGGYAWLVSSRGTGKLRSDQAGDNCYYLGLIYTLVSLAHAIFTFDPANTATTIVQGFGIALLTTIFGLILRVFFNQSRVDLHEIEDSARLELAEAAGRMKGQLAQVANSFRDFAFGIQQSIEELRAAAAGSIGGAADESVQVIKDLAAAAGESLASETSLLKERVAELSKATTKTVSSMDKHARGLEEVTEKQAAAVENFAALDAAVAAAARASEDMRKQLEASAAVQTSISSAAAQLAESVARLQGSVSTNLASFSALHEEFKARLEELGSAPQAKMDSALNAVAAAADRLSAAIGRIAEQHEDAGRSIESLSSGVVSALQAHNQEMEAELGRSRDNVVKVHSALVGMTSSLAEQIEQRTRQ